MCSNAIAWNAVAKLVQWWLCSRPAATARTRGGRSGGGGGGVLRRITALVRVRLLKFAGEADGSDEEAALVVRLYVAARIR